MTRVTLLARIIHWICGCNHTRWEPVQPISGYPRKRCVLCGRKRLL